MRFNLVVPILGWVTTILAMPLDISDEDSVCDAAAHIVRGQMDYYQGLKYGGTVGEFVPPYYWWHAGEVFGGWVDYWAFCQKDNTTFTQILLDAMWAQRGDDYNYIPSNQSLTEGNDDQGVWGMAIMQAVERNFTLADDDHSWLNMIQALYNSMNNRWDKSTCGGGLRWQIFSFNNGYTYKNSIANGCLFHLAARLYRYTNESSYLDAAERAYDWMWDVGFMKDDPFLLYDGADVDTNCTDFTTHKWSYTYGIFLAGSAYLYNSTGDQKWKDSVDQLLEASSYFFKNSIMTETTCAPSSCNNDQRSFRSLFSRCLGLTAVLVPETYDHIVSDWLEPSAEGAAKSCSGDGENYTCGQDWATGYDNTYGLGEQMSALEVIMSMITTKNPPLTPATGGSDKGNNVAAGNSTLISVNVNQISVSGKDRAGAAIATTVVLGIVLGGAVWMLF